MSGGKIRVALLAGGKSGERDVSLRGAAEVYKSLDFDKYEVIRYDPAIDMAKLATEADSLDVAFILMHGLLGEDGAVQGFLDLLSLPYQGSGVLGSALAMDKDLAKTIYQNSGLPTPGWMMVEQADMRDVCFVEQLGLPLVIKPVRQGSSIGMSIAHNEEELVTGLQTAFEYDREVMVEQHVVGREITVGVLGNDELVALPLVEIIPGSEHPFFNYQAKYEAGASQEICPADMPSDVVRMAQDYAIKAHEKLKLRGYSRTDMMVNERGVFLLETNTIPGMTPTSLLPQAAAVAGLSFAALLDKLLELAIE